MENKAHFGSLTPGMQAYRESVLDQKPYIDARRAVLATEAYKKNLNQPPVMKRALMLQNILAGMDIYIEDETILVGNQSSVNRGAPVFSAARASPRAAAFSRASAAKRAANPFTASMTISTAL